MSRKLERGFITEKKDMPNNIACTQIVWPKCVYVEALSVSSMLYHVQEEAFPPLGTTKSMISLLLTEVCNEVYVEPDLQPVSQGQLNGLTANQHDGARLDVAANGFWGGRYERTYLDVRIVNPFAPSNKMSQVISSMYRKPRGRRNEATSRGF